MKNEHISTPTKPAQHTAIRLDDDSASALSGLAELTGLSHSGIIRRLIVAAASDPYLFGLVVQPLERLQDEIPA